MERKKILMLAAAVAVCQLAGIIGSFYTVQAIPEWYAALEKPAFNPPNWLFGPVWVTLYTLMGIALFLVWERGVKTLKERLAVSLFFIQLILNALWSIIFFGLKELGFAFGWIMALWIFIAATTAMFWKIDRRAAALMLPYLAWTSFAAILNYSIWALN